MFLPLPSDDKTVESEPATPNTDNPSHLAVTILKEKHPSTQQSESSQFTQTRSGCISKPSECLIY